MEQNKLPKQPWLTTIPELSDQDLKHVKDAICLQNAHATKRHKRKQHCFVIIKQTDKPASTDT